MNKSKIPAAAWAEMLKRKNIEFISGKWFLDKKEIKDIDKFALSTFGFENVKQKDDALDYFRQAFGTSGVWYDLPIIEEAKAADLRPLCYPLNQKQLKIINYLLRHDEEVFFILTGVGGSGKSTFANIICQIFENDTAPLNLSELSEPFMLATAAAKRLIYSDEINSDEINGGKIKQLISNQEITVNPKNKSPYKTRIQAAFFFNCNIPPRLDLADSGMMRRILYYGMNEKIKKPDKTLNHRTWTHEDLVNIVAHALSVDMTNWRDDFEDDTRNYLVKNNSVFMFKDCEKYPEYVTKTRESGLKPFSEPKWAEIRKLLKEWQFIGYKKKEELVPVPNQEEFPF